MGVGGQTASFPEFAHFSPGTVFQGRRTKITGQLKGEVWRGIVMIYIPMTDPWDEDVCLPTLHLNFR